MSNEKILHSEIDIKDVPRTVKREWISWIRFILIIVILYGAIHYTIGYKNCQWGFNESYDSGSGYSCCK
nr:hypothetical protein [Heyndrickxia oleronia]